MSSRLTVIVLLSLVCGAAGSWAQEPKLIQPLRLYGFAGWVELGYEIERADRKPGLSGFRSEQDEKTAIAGLSLDLDGSFLHQKLLPFTLGGTLRLRQTDVQTTTGRLSGSQDSNDSNYRFRLGILPEKRWTGEIMASSFVQEIDSSFAAPRLVRRRTEQFSLIRKSRSWPLRFRWQRSRYRGILGDPRNENRDNLTATITHRGETLNFRARGDVLDYMERFSRQDYTTKTLTANAGWRPAGSTKLILTTAVYGFDRTGTTAASYFIASETADFTPYEALRFNGVVEYQKQEEEIGRREIHKAIVGANHLLWGSLLTKLSWHAERQQLPFEGTFDFDEGAIGFDYSRTLAPGNLALGWSRNRRDERQFLPTRELMITEEHQYEPGFPLILEQPGILPGSVRVTNPAGTVVYAEGIDYELIHQGDLTELAVLASGTIQAGDLLSVSYLIETPLNRHLVATLRRVKAAWRGRSGLWVGYSWLDRSNDLLEGPADGRIEDVTETQIKGGISRDRWRIQGGITNRDSSILPYRNKHAGVSWQALAGFTWRLNLRAQVRQTTYPDQVDDTRARLIGSELRVNYRRLRVDLALERWNESILGREGRYLQGNLVARWSFRALDLLLRWRLRNQSIEISGVDNREEIRLLLRRRIR